MQVWPHSILVRNSVARIHICEVEMRWQVMPQHLLLVCHCIHRQQPRTTKTTCQGGITKSCARQVDRPSCSRRWGMRPTSRRCSNRTNSNLDGRGPSEQLGED